MTSFFQKEPGYSVISRLEKAGYEAVFVGGAVRDYILGKTAKDIDIATSAEPDNIKMVFRHTVDVGIAHGTVLVLFNGEPVEVTTYRTEGTYTDHRRPDAVEFVKSLKEDLLRRDFTMNALAMTKDGDLIDPFDGRLDLQKELIRAVGNPLERFKEDALRMLRAIRFSSVLNFTIEEETLVAIRKSAEQISHISTERLKMEMDKLFTGINPLKAFRYMENTELNLYLPLYPSKIHFLSDPILFKSAIEGWAYFMIAGSFTPSETVKAYKLSKDERTFISSVKKAYDRRNIGLFEIDDYYKFKLDVLLTTERLYSLFNKNHPILSASEIEKNKNSLQIHSIADLSIDGKDLLEWTGLSGGRWLGEWIAKIESAVLHGECENEETTIKDWFFYEFNSKR